MRIAKRLQPLLPPLPANAALLVPAKNRLRRRLLPRVDEHGAGLQTLADALRARDVLAPHAGAEPGERVVGALDDFFLVGPGLGGDDGA